MSNNVRKVLVCVAALSAASCGGASVSGGASAGPVSVSGSAGGSVQAGGTVTVGISAPPPPAQMAHLRVIHASPEPLAASVAMYVDGSGSPAVPSLNYRNAAGYLDIPAGAHNLAVRPAAAPPSSPPALEERTPPLVPDRFYTLVAHGLVGGTPGLSVAATVDDNVQPAAGSAHVRFFHALAGMSTVDVCLPGPQGAHGPGIPVFSNVAYGLFGTAVSGQGAYAVVPSGRAFTLQVRQMNRNACTGPIAGLVTASVPDRAVVTAVAIGNVLSNPPVPRELLVCTDAPLSGPSTCLPVPIAVR
jgi:hypothetical protein